MPDKIVIWGYGREGRANLAYLKTRHPDAAFYVVDNLPQDIEGVKILIGAEGEQKISEGFFDLVVKSPGISLYKDAVKEAKKNGSAFTSSTNMWFEKFPKARKLVVTGTKGKSTTSSLIHHILLHSGYKSALAGNIGIPLMSMEPGDDITVLELSSYQIADLQYAPDLAIILNLYPEHRDWHGSTEQYYADKTRIASLSKDMPVVSNESSLKGNILPYHEVPWDDSMPEIFKGAHNRRNLGAALAAIKAMGFTISDLSGALNSYKPLPHRQELVADKNGIRWINDSISTVPETAIAALDMHQGRPVTIILGGQDRGQDYTALAERIKNHGGVKVLTLPDNGSRIAELIDSVPCQTLAQAVAKALQITSQGGVVLLSPAAPSYGHFKNFEDRGEQFRALVNSL